MSETFEEIKGQLRISKRMRLEYVKWFRISKNCGLNFGWEWDCNFSKLLKLQIFIHFYHPRLTDLL